MALFAIQTNAPPQPKFEKQLLSNVRLILERNLNLPSQYISGSISSSKGLVWSGRPDPVILVSIQTVQKLDPKLTAKYSADLHSAVVQLLRINDDAIIIHFTEKVPSDVSFNGSLFLYNDDLQFS